MQLRQEADAPLLVCGVQGVGTPDKEAVGERGKDCEWGRSEAPAVRLLWDVRVVDAVAEFLESTRVGCGTATKILGPWEEEGQASGEGEEGGWASLGCISLCLFPLFSHHFPLFFLCPPFCQVGRGAEDWACPRLTHSGLGLEDHVKKARRCP